MKSHPGVTVVIPHSNGKDLLRRCLLALGKTQYPVIEVLVVDNGSTDRSVSMVRSEFPGVRIVRSRKNLGFAAGCNLGIRASGTPFIALLNNDAEVTPGWLNPLIQCALENKQAAALQPKILSLKEPGRFDYCGAAGGEIDIFGYPFARGRLFETLEKDTGQYDKTGRVFWASGAACLLRRSALERVGLLDERFFAHMEEIDLNWRLHWAGYSVWTVPKAVVFHQTGGTLGQGSIRKMALNHRNNILMLLKNVPGITLSWILPLRILLEMITAAGSLFTGRFNRTAAVLWGMSGVPGKLPAALSERRRIKNSACVPENEIMRQMFRGSAALAYYVRGIRTAECLMGIRRT
ncbi:MAG TPA: glycosyltransferase family 2 protein [bacterium]|nr:glycosyltransferase family 2 protein [bacterium]